MNRNAKFFTLTCIACAIGAFFYFDLGQYFTLEYLKTQQEAFQKFYAAHPIKTLALFFSIYVLVTAFSLPGAAIMTLLAGALFGIVTGVIVVSFASSIGATLAFLVSRFLFRDWVESKFKSAAQKFNQGIKKDGRLYLFTLRLIPAVPFFVINLAMGLTQMKTFSFYWVSQLGMFLGTLVYINAGTQLSKINSLRGIVSPKVLASFILLGLFPLISKKIVGVIKARKVYKPYPRPKRYDYNMVVIGAGSAGLVTSYIGAATKGKVALIEKHKMGGDCLNTGCVPSKALIRTAKFLADVKKSKSLGIQNVEVEYSFADVMERVQRVIQTIEPHDSVERYTKLGVECIEGEATIKTPFEVEVSGRTLTTRNIVIATGARPFIPSINGIEDVKPLTSDTIWDLRERPKRLLVLGGGPIGSELTQAFSRVGCEVTQVEMAPRLLSREDPEISEMVLDSFQKDGVRVLLNHKAEEFRMEGGRKILTCSHQDQKVEIEFDEVLVAVGRQANVKGFGLEELGIELTQRKTIAVNERMQTRFPNIYACGDVAGPYQFTHTAAHQAWFCAVNSMLHPFWGFDVDYRVIPWSTFTDPEVARVGLNETEAKEQGIEVEVTTYGIDDLDRAIADEDARGLVKVLTPPGKDKILGVTIVGSHAGDIITEYIAAMKHGFGLNKILGTIHIYPTLGEANKYAAGNWKKNNVTQKTLNWGERLNRWRRDYL